MPPSGYRKEQGSIVEKFLTSISSDLRTEGEKYNLNPTNALKKEIENIDEVLLKENNQIHQSVLKLTQSFYREIQSRVSINSSWDDFDTVVQKCAAHAHKSICSIKGPRLG